tara:strand:- start:1380 stop:1724 length:345 start_codon:yes stop_codon:yes gene_type:complete
MKTLKLFEQYKELYSEQDEVEDVDVNVDVEADATDVADIPPAPTGISPEGEVYVAELLTNAFIYAPNMQDINIAAQVNKEFGRTQPRKVIETIERLVEFSDETVEQELETVDAH